MDPHPAIGGLWRPAGLDEEGLRPSDVPTRESKDVIEALAAHEFSIARARQDPLAEEQEAPAPLSVEWDLSCVEDPAPPEVNEDFEESLPTRIKEPSRAAPPPRPVRPSVKVIPRELLPPWPLPATPRRTAVRPPPTGAIWRVLLASGVLVSMGLVVLYLRGASVVSLEGPASVEAAPPVAAPVDPVNPPTVVFDDPPPAAAATEPAALVPRSRPVTRKRRSAAPAALPRSAAGAEAEVAPAPEPAGLDQRRPNPF